MNILPNALTNRRGQLAVVSAVLAVSSIFFVVRATLINSSTTPPVLTRADVRTPDNPYGSEAGMKPPARVLILRRSGFDPANVSWPKDRFFLAIDNHTGVNDITLFLDREVGGRVKEVNFKMRKQRSVGMFDLPPGHYVLTEANHPGWVCRITITPQ